MSKTAKLFKNGRSQAVRLPAAFRFDAEEVFIRKDEATGDVILSARPTNWDSFFEAIKDLEVPEDFLGPRERDHGPNRPDPFEGMDE